jgi:hypothetical protein
MISLTLPKHLTLKKWGGSIDKNKLKRKNKKEILNSSSSFYLFLLWREYANTP